MAALTFATVVRAPARSAFSFSTRVGPDVLLEPVQVLFRERLGQALYDLPFGEVAKHPDRLGARAPAAPAAAGVDVPRSARVVSGEPGDAAQHRRQRPSARLAAQQAA